jgi:cytoplasmic iron level regulating protein YaaA (DUF328/UPF0246 family)
MSLCNPRYLLIVACSQRKRSDPGLLPAIARYDGGHFRVLRKAKREGYWSKNLDVLILSAKYGLIEASTPIANYEQRMNRKQASELKAQVTQVLDHYAKQRLYSEVYVDLGQDYRSAVEALTGLFKDQRVAYAYGRIGERLGQLKRWLAAKSKENSTCQSHAQQLSLDS